MTLAAVALNPGIIDTRMLRSCFGEGASSYPTPEEWAKVAVPFLTSLSALHNGKALTVPWMTTDDDADDDTDGLDEDDPD